MTTISISTQVNASPDAVFDAYTDFERAADMVSAIEKIEMLTQPPTRVGTRFRETRRMYGKAATEEMTVIAYQRPRYAEITADSHGTHYLARYDFKLANGGTLVTLSFTGVPQTLTARILGLVMAPLITSSMRKMMQSDMDEVKAHVEAHP